MNKRQWLVLSWIAAAVFFLADRVAKWLIISFVWRSIPLCRFIYLDCVLNRGISHGMLYFQSNIAFGILSVAVAILLLAVMAWTYRIYRDGYNIFGHMLIISGGLSNILDRVLYGGVVDYVGVLVGPWHFPIFNIADVAVVCGVVILVFQGIHDEG